MLHMVLKKNSLEHLLVTHSLSQSFDHSVASWQYNRIAWFHINGLYYSLAFFWKSLNKLHVHISLRLFHIFTPLPDMHLQFGSYSCSFDQTRCPEFKLVSSHFKQPLNTNRK